MVWKFLFWPAVWIMILIPGWIWPLYLDGINRLATFFLGFILFAGSMALTAVGGRTLKRFAHRQNSKTFWPDSFTEKGIFGCMRHPMYLGLALLPVSVAMMWGSIPAILASGWGVAAAFWFVLVIEEKETLQRFGDEYSQYMQRTSPFILSLKCLRMGYETVKRGK
ncbi:MAG: methyltransferase [Thermodesulfobacteriota bacterium]|nr:methyltransferase [Thermodesulfobacteriota bacterium]